MNAPKKKTTFFGVSTEGNRFTSFFITTLTFYFLNPGLLTNRVLDTGWVQGGSGGKKMEYQYENNTRKREREEREGGGTPLWLYVWVCVCV